MSPVTFGPPRYDRGYFIAGAICLLALGVVWLGHNAAVSNDSADNLPSMLPNYVVAVLLIVGALVVLKATPLRRGFVGIDATGITLECTRGYPLLDRQICKWIDIKAFFVELRGHEEDNVIGVVLAGDEQRMVPLQSLRGTWEDITAAMERQAEALGYGLAYSNQTNLSVARHLWTLTKTT